MRDFFLSEGEVRQVTGCSNADAQEDMLRNMKIPYFRPGSDKPKVVREVLVQVQVARSVSQASSKAAKGPKLENLNG